MARPWNRPTSDRQILALNASTPPLSQKYGRDRATRRRGGAGLIGSAPQRRSRLTLSDDMNLARR
jgi:hypothetical protein